MPVIPPYILVEVPQAYQAPLGTAGHQRQTMLVPLQVLNRPQGDFPFAVAAVPASAYPAVAANPTVAAAPVVTAAPAVASPPEAAAPASAPAEAAAPAPATAEGDAIRRQTVPLPAYLFNEDCMQKTTDREKEDGARRPTVAVPAYLFNEDAAAKAQERQLAAAERRQTTVLPQYVFDEDAALKHKEREEAAAERRQTTVLPQYVFDEDAALKHKEREEAAAERRQTTVLPQHVFDEDAALKHKEREEAAAERRQTTVLPQHVFDEDAALKHNAREAAAERRLSDAPLPSFMFREQSKGDSPLHATPASAPLSRRESSVPFPMSLFNSFRSLTQDSPQHLLQQLDEGEGPYVQDVHHDLRRIDPVQPPPAEEEDHIFDAPGASSDVPHGDSPRASSSGCLSTVSPTRQGTATRTPGKEGLQQQPETKETFITAPCCGRSTVKSDVRPFKRPSYCNTTSYCLHQAQFPMSFLTTGHT
ncbi:dual-specificity phosphatase, catalytic domain-containing protein, putative [Eimeria maxima]|uniref:Dual-specificity phosphatase, catalytic domain-containing protein, putative n=1 Tax=Eimeria maxima TaxID=5804 RepID=U6MF31_EIMMA|nr:dual-specificity phosphatase, catalytic domain-containing protein, putative [Eimeria maxima]CDJ61658.1 dual-specificity phosphatase, catalytic domain-containing protein, putative [Eimeria maxima]